MLIDYVRIARPDHWFKNVFMLPGVLLAWLASPPDNPFMALLGLVAGFFATCMIASANYTLNEWIDAKTDAHHPDKKDRPAASGRIKTWGAVTQWCLLGLIGLDIAWLIGPGFLFCALMLFAQGVLYNVRPIRTKDMPVLDVLSESVNNPIRFGLGWYAIGVHLIPPISLLMAYYMLGAFFMAVKRMAEYRHIDNPELAGAYRASFRWYTQEKLITSILFYATAFALFAGIFLAKYRYELILAVPFYAGMAGYYMHLGFLPNSPAQNPEHLWRYKGFSIFMAVTSLLTVVLLLWDMPVLYDTFNTTIPWGF